MTARFAATPEEVLPPGLILQQLLYATGRTQADLARSTGISTKHLSQLVTGKASLTVDMAKTLAKETGVPARLWLALEANWALTNGVDQ